MEYIVITAVSLWTGIMLGYSYRDIRREFTNLRLTLDKKKDKPVEDSPKSSLVDPLDPQEQARQEYLERMKEINPDD